MHFGCLGYNIKTLFFLPIPFPWKFVIFQNYQDQKSHMLPARTKIMQQHSLRLIPISNSSLDCTNPSWISSPVRCGKTSVLTVKLSLVLIINPSSAWTRLSRKPYYRGTLLTRHEIWYKISVSTQNSSIYTRGQALEAEEQRTSWVAPIPYCLDFDVN